MKIFVFLQVTGYKYFIYSVCMTENVIVHVYKAKSIELVKLWKWVLLRSQLVGIRKNSAKELMSVAGMFRQILQKLLLYYLQISLIIY